MAARLSKPNARSDDGPMHSGADASGGDDAHGATCDRHGSRWRRWPQALLIALVRGYQVGLSSWLPPRCRYVPSCSEYAILALRRFGPGRGAWLAAKRMLRCHPWGASGYDPVPEVAVDKRKA